MPLISATDALTAGTAAGATVALTAATSAQVIAANPERNGLQIQSDPANTATVYLLMGTGTASSTSAHIALAAGGSAGVTIDAVVWRGAVQAVCSAAAKLLVAEA